MSEIVLANINHLKLERFNEGKVSSLREEIREEKKKGESLEKF